MKFSDELSRTGIRAMPRIAQICASAMIATLLSLAQAVAQESRPNILLVVLDDAGFMDFGAYGSETRTPNIDALAREGVMFSRFYTSPFCGPSRAMLLTGMDNHQVGMGTLVETVSPELRQYPGYTMTWDDGQETIATLLSDAGYQTFVSGKWGIGEVGANLPDRFGFDRSYVMDATGGSNYDQSHYLPGYDRVDWFEDGARISLPDDFYSSRSLVDRLIEYVDEGDPERPFFAYLAFQAVHIPVQAPLSYIEGYDGVFDAGWDVIREQRRQRAIELGLVPPTTQLAPSPQAHRAWEALSPEDQAEAARMMQVNAGMMEAADHHLGRLLAHLDATGQLDNTLVIVTSDNGAEAAMMELPGALANTIIGGIRRLEGYDASPDNHGLPGSLTAIGPEWASVSSAPFQLYKFYASEGGLRVPLVIAGPGIAPSSIQRGAVHVADLMPTMLDVAGVPYDTSAYYGRSFLPVLTGEAERSYAEDESFAFEVSGNAAVYRGNWKITRNAQPRGDSQWRLYDLSVDPGETTDLSADHPELFADMLAEYRSYSQEVGVVELPPGEYAMKQLTKNLIAKTAAKYWPYLLAFLLLLAGTGYGIFRGVRFVARRIFG